jgi:hypothetical protein
MLDFLMALMALVLVYHKNLPRLYSADTVYAQDKITNNSLTMQHSFNATAIPANTQPFSFPEDTKDLPDPFEYGGNLISTQDFFGNKQTSGFLVLKDRKIVSEDYWLGHQQDKQHISFSVAKSFVSALMGIAIEEGYVASIEQDVTDYVPELMKV